MVLETSALFSLTFVLRLGAVWARGFLLSGGVSRKPLLQKSTEEEPPLKGRPDLWHLQVSDLTYFMAGRCV